MANENLQIDAAAVHADCGGTMQVDLATCMIVEMMKAYLWLVPSAGRLLLPASWPECLLLCFLCFGLVVRAAVGLSSRNTLL